MAKKPTNESVQPRRPSQDPRGEVSIHSVSPYGAEQANVKPLIPTESTGSAETPPPPSKD